MKHLGDITKISGYDAPIVDVITGGSPCQDLSVAGKRAGLDGERSGLFMEQIRIVKEMRKKYVDTHGTDEPVRPRFMVWENVPGAFSSNGGKDFQAVLTEIVRIAEPAAVDVPLFGGGRRWPKAGVLMGIGANGQPFSVCYRVHDAQFWGVPQRRKRIALVADFGGISAPEVLFERKGVSGDFEPGETAREETASDVGRSPASAISFQERAGCAGGGKGILIQNERTGALSTLNNQSVVCLQGNGIDRAETAGCNGCGWNEDDVCYTLNTIDRPAVCAGFKAGQSKNGGIGWEVEQAPTLSADCSGTEPTVFDARGNGNGKTAPTITGDHENRITDYTAICIGNGQADQTKISDKVGALNCMHDQQAVITYGLDRAAYNQGTNAQYQFSVEEEKIGAQVARGPGAVCAAVDCRNGTENTETNGTLQAKENGTSYNYNNVCRTNAIVRRLTPLECERLQGYPDFYTSIGDWVDTKGKKHKDADSPRYKALGNSIALPFWQWLANRICNQYDRTVEMASLFDGIGGFPLVFERAGGKAVWASEIEEFPIAVTKVRFPE